MSAALVDASAMVAAFGRRQAQTDRYLALLKLASEQHWSLATTWPCVTEASHIVSAPDRFSLLRWIAAGAVSIFPFGQEALDEMVELMRRYTPRPRTEMDLADASLVCLAADTNVTTILTLDVRDFSRYRLPDGRAFDIL